MPKSMPHERMRHVSPQALDFQWALEMIMLEHSEFFTDRCELPRGEDDRRRENVVGPEDSGDAARGFLIRLGFAPQRSALTLRLPDDRNALPSGEIPRGGRGQIRLPLPVFQLPRAFGRMQGVAWGSPPRRCRRITGSLLVLSAV